MPSSSRQRWLVGPALGAVIVALFCGAAVCAHEIGTTRVSVLFQEGRTYDVEIVTDAAALVEKLEASAGSSAAADTTPARLQSLLTSSDETFRRRLKVAFDASDVRPAIAYSVAPGIDGTSAPVATIRLTGQIPPAARHFTWTYAWTFASYAMTIRSAISENPATEWLEGGQSSAPFPLAANPLARGRGSVSTCGVRVDSALTSAAPSSATSSAGTTYLVTYSGPADGSFVYVVVDRNNDATSDSTAITIDGTVS